MGYNGVVDVSDGMAQFHLNQLDSFFDASADTAGRPWWRGIGTHASNLVQVTPELLESSVQRVIRGVNTADQYSAAVVTGRYFSARTAGRQ